MSTRGCRTRTTTASATTASTSRWTMGEPVRFGGRPRTNGSGSSTSQACGWKPSTAATPGSRSKTTAVSTSSWPAARRSIACARFRAEELPMPLGDDVDGAVDDANRGVVVDRICRIPECGRPALRLGHRVLWQGWMIHVREDRKVDNAERFVATGGRLPADEVLPDPRRQHHASGAEPDKDCLTQ